MSAIELILKKMEQKKTEPTTTWKTEQTCVWCGCDDNAVMDGLCWYHYQEEHYLGR